MPLTQSPLYDLEALAAHKMRAPSEEHFLFEESAALLIERIEAMKGLFSVARLNGPAPERLRKVLPQDAKKPPDLVVSHMELHWANTPVTRLKELTQPLCAGGIFLGVLWGSETLKELKGALTQAEIGLSGGLSPRFSPLPTLNQASLVLESAGFSEIVVDREAIRVEIENFTALLHLIRAMGETNALRARPKHFTRRTLFQKAEEIYMRDFNIQGDGLQATFELLFLHGRKP